MLVVDFIIGRAPKRADPAPQIKGMAVSLGGLDDPDPPKDAAVYRRYILEPYFAMIEYTDADGTVTRRRVTMRKVEERGEYRYLTAVCHERSAVRSFRLDRISCLISQDGEIEDAAPWFDEILSISEVEDVAVTPRRAAAPRPSISPYTALRRTITAPLTLLVAAARSDDYLHPRELSAILRYAEDAAIDLRNRGIIPELDADLFDKLERTVRRLRPTREDLDAAVPDIAKLDRAALLRLAHALTETVRADGRVDEIEADIVAELNELGARAHGHGWQD